MVLLTLSEGCWSLWDWFLRSSQYAAGEGAIYSK